MAYHISLVNTDKKDIYSKLIMNKEKFREFLFREFNMKEELNSIMIKMILILLFFILKVLKVNITLIARMISI